MEILFIQLAIVLLVAFLVSYIVRLFKQPILVGYIIAGVLVSPFVVGFGASKELIDVFSKFGVAFLLFIVGLHLNPKIVKEIGVKSLIVGLLQIVIIFVIGYFVSLKFLGFDSLVSVYIGIALSFSSTIIITKILSDQGLLDSLFGKLSIGILIIQDFVAVFVLMFISSYTNGLNFVSFALTRFTEGVILIGVLFFFGFFVLSHFTRGIAKSQELLFLFSICWCFFVAALFSYFGFSMEIGALMAGMILSVSPYSVEISSKIRPLRDFFLVIFFTILGFNIPLNNLGSILGLSIVLSLIALILKPFILIVLLSFFGYTPRSNFSVGTSLGQISELSLILISLGVANGSVPLRVLSAMTLTGVITIALSSYMIIYSKEFYDRLSKFLSLGKKFNPEKEKSLVGKKYDTILFGYNRIGFGILRTLSKMKRNFLIVDFNPDTISDLEKLRIPCVYGDAYDSDFLSELPLGKAKLIVSTIPDFETNLLLIETVERINPDSVIIVRAHQIQEALDLYKKGADYVLTPHFLGGEYVANMISELKDSEKEYKNEKEKHVKMLQEMMKRGHEHPEVERN
jgi:Kef-type K+ transport system membrane component KefB/Trk K+ transport system NAD-binding subunit